MDVTGILHELDNTAWSGADMGRKTRQSYIAWDFQYIDKMGKGIIIYGF